MMVNKMNRDGQKKSMKGNYRNASKIIGEHVESGVDETIQKSKKNTRGG
jgi:hypothetical protein